MHESVTHVPMIWSEPDAEAPRVSTALASTVDMATTILDRIGEAPYVGMQGRSLLANVEAGDTPVRDAMLVEYSDGFVRMGFDTPARARSVMTKDWRLTVYRDLSWGELYERAGDPKQACNLWDDPDYATVKADMLERLAHQLIALMDG